MLVLLFLAPVDSFQAQEVARMKPAARNIEHLLGIPAADRGKCGTSAIALAYAQWAQLAPRTRDAITQALQRPALQKSRLSPGGRFRIHYDTTGFDSPALVSAGQRIPGTHDRFVDSVGYYFEHVWKLAVDTLSYIAPPSDGAQGGGPEYDIYIQELGTDMFGQTSWSFSSDLIENGVRQRFSTYIEIDNDFAGYRTAGIDGLKVTAAHEFLHALQIGSYGIWTNVPNNDFYFYELTSVWMEHVCFPSIHDYYYYLPKFFQSYRDGQDRSLPFTTYNGTFRGYERSLWAHFLAKRFGRDVIRSIWTGMKQMPSLMSTSAVVAQRGSSLQAEFAVFGYWNYFTADRANPLLYYEEGPWYPRYKPNVSMDFAGMTASISTSAPAMSSQLYQFVIERDTITAVVANVNIAAAVQITPPMDDLTLKLSSSDRQPPYQLVAGGLGMSFIVSEKNVWKTHFLLASTRGNAVTTPDAAPNPLRLSVDGKLVLPLSEGRSKRADVYFLNGALEQVFAHQYDVQESLGRVYLEIPSMDLRSRVTSGVYYVIAKCGADEFKWKVAIIR